MATLEAGLFFFMLVIAFIFTFFAWRTIGAMSGLLHMVAMAFFVGLAIFMASGYQVASTSSSTYNDGTTQWNQTSTYVIMQGGTSSYWLWYVFFGFAILNLSMFIRDVWMPGERKE